MVVSACLMIIINSKSNPKFRSYENNVNFFFAQSLQFCLLKLSNIIMAKIRLSKFGTNVARKLVA